MQPGDFISRYYLEHFGSSPERGTSAVGIPDLDGEQPVVRVLLLGSMAGMVAGREVRGLEARRNVSGIPHNKRRWMDALTGT